MSAGLLSKARRIASILDGQLRLGLFEELAGMERRDGLLRSRDEVLVVYISGDLLKNTSVRKGPYRANPGAK